MGRDLKKPRRENLVIHSSGYQSGKAIVLVTIVAVSGIALAAGIFYGVAKIRQMSQARPAITLQIFERGKQIYLKQCAGCHGVDGRGDGKAAYLLYPKPRDFTRGEFRLISRKDNKPTDQDLFKTITRGMPGSAMPPWDHLSAKDRWSLVTYVRYLWQLDAMKKAGDIKEAGEEDLDWGARKKLMTEEVDPEAIVGMTKEPPANSESVTRGRELFLKGCAPCHGELGKGDGKQAMKDSLGLPLQARDLTSGLFKGASASEDLYARMVAGLPGTPMPSYQEAYKDAQIWDLIHYVQTLPRPGVEERMRLKHNRIPVQKIDGDVPADPSAEVWKSLEPVFIALAPLWWRDERVDGVEVKALHNGRQIAIHLSWPDATQDSSAIAPQSFPDAAALQLSTEKDPPFFAMGGPTPVFIWHWKALWQDDLKNRKDIETEYPNTATDWYSAQTNYKHGDPFETRDSKTPFHDPGFMGGWGAGNPLSDPQRKTAAEEGMAKGIGSYTAQHPRMENVKSNGVWKDEKWEVVFVRSLTSTDEGALQLEPGKSASVAFAIWDGSQRDRNGQKMVSIWNDLILEK